MIERVRSWLAELPSTNYQIFISSILASVVVSTVCAAMLLRIDVQEEVLYPICGLIGSLAGVGAYQFTAKRKTSAEHFEGMAKVEEAKKPPAPAAPTVNVAGNANVDTPPK